MDHQKRSELICWTTEEFIKGRSSARIKSELIENDVPQHEYQVIILVAKKNVYENYKKQMIDTGIEPDCIGQLDGWSTLDKEVQDYIINQSKFHDPPIKTLPKVDDLNLSLKVSYLVGTIWVFACLGFVLSLVSIKERLFDDDEKVGVKILIICWFLAASIFLKYPPKYKKILENEEDDESIVSVWEIVGYLQVAIIFIFFWYIAYEAKYYKPIPFIYVLNLIFLFLILWGSYYRKIRLNHKDSNANAED